MMRLMTGGSFDAQAFTADQIQRHWQGEGLAVTRTRLADGTLRLAASGRSAVLIYADGSQRPEDATPP
jgi:hypothetical protein